MYPNSQHRELAKEALRLYRMRVEDALVGAQPPVHKGLRRLVTTLAKTETNPEALTIRDFTPMPEVWQAAQADQLLRHRLTNEYVLGLGWDGAPVVVMGTEAADDIAGSWADLAFQSYLPALIAAGGPPSLTSALYTCYPETKRRRSSSRPYHIEPWDWGANAAISPRNTWACVAQAVSPTDWRRLIDGPHEQPGLGARVYQIERSAASALRAARGSPPSVERLSFLVQKVMPRLRRSARVLLIHGYGQPWPLWKERTEAIASAFLGTSVDFPWPQGKDTEWKAYDDRLVVWCTALNRGNRKVTDEYIKDVRDLVLRFAPVGDDA